MHIWIGNSKTENLSLGRGTRFHTFAGPGRGKRPIFWRDLMPNADKEHLEYCQQLRINNLKQEEFFVCRLINSTKEAKYLDDSPERKLLLLIETINFGDSIWLQTIEYPEFLKSLYWKIVRDYMIFLQEHCQLCCSFQNLNVHHKTYKNRGFEFEEPTRNLIVLCKSCHEKFHGIINNEN